MLCDNGIYDITVNDYLRNNKGYKLFYDVNKSGSNKIKALLAQKSDDMQSGVKTALNKKEASVTGMGFSIWSSSFVNHVIYAAMQASTINKQEKAATQEFQREVNALCSRLESNYDRDRSDYIKSEYIPNMEKAFTLLVYEMLDKYVSDLILNDKFNSTTLSFVDINRSNELLENLKLSDNKKAILEKAFLACPYNAAIYIAAIRYDLLDIDSFQAAKTFKCDNTIVSYLDSHWGKVSYPKIFDINYRYIKLLSLFTNRNPEDILRIYTESYAETIVQAYLKISIIFSDSSECNEIMCKISENTLLSNEMICLEKAQSYINNIVTQSIWNQLTTSCGHTNLIERIITVDPTGLKASNKKDLDNYYIEKLTSSFEEARQSIIIKINAEKESEKKLKEKQEQQLLIKKAKQKKKIKIIRNTVSVVLVFFLSYSIIFSYIIPSYQYSKALRHFNNSDYEKALELFTSLNDYKDSKTNLLECEYNLAKNYIEEEKYADALKILNKWFDYKDGQKLRDIAQLGLLKGDIPEISSDYSNMISVGGSKSVLRILNNNQVVGISNNPYGQEQVSDWQNIISVSVGDKHAIGLKNDGTVLSTGYSIDSRCDVSAWNNIKAISAGWDYSLGLKTDGTVISTEYINNSENYVGQCDVSQWEDIISISAGAFHSVGLKTDGTVVCTKFTGDNFTHHCGGCNVSSWSEICEISAGYDHIVGLKKNGTVIATGRGDDGQCNVSNWRDIIAISAGTSHTVGLKRNGTVVAVGYNGNGCCDVSDWTDIIAVDASDEYTVGLKSDGTIVIAGNTRLY